MRIWAILLLVLGILLEEEEENNEFEEKTRKPEKLKKINNSPFITFTIHKSTEDLCWNCYNT